MNLMDGIDVLEDAYICSIEGRFLGSEKISIREKIMLVR